MVASVVVPVICAVPATVKRLVGAAVPIPKLPAPVKVKRLAPVEEAIVNKFVVVPV